MKESMTKNMDALVLSIGVIGKNSKEMEFNSKRIVEKLRKNRAELVQDSFDSAFDPSHDKSTL